MAETLSGWMEEVDSVTFAQGKYYIISNMVMRGGISPEKRYFFCVLLYGRTLYYVGFHKFFNPLYRDLGLRRVQDVKHCYYHLLLRKWGGARPRRVVSFVVIA